MKWLAIFNPTAHNGACLNHLRSLARLLRREVGAQCVWSSYPRQARDLARSGRDFEGLIAVGGDGTIYEIVNGMNLKSQCLGIVPAGTGNGLAHELRIRNDLSAFQHLRHPRLAPIDLIQVRFRIGGSWQQRCVVHNAAVGYIAEVVALGLGSLKPLGYLRYAAAAGVQCFRQKSFRARMRIDGGVEQELFLTNLTVNNTRYAGTFRLFPKASLQDGRLDLLYGRNTPSHQLFEDLGILTQTYFGGRSVRGQARMVHVELALPLTLTLDGELFPQVEAVQFEVLKGCLRCVAGSRSGLKLLDEEQSSLPPAEPALGPELARC